MNTKMFPLIALAMLLALSGCYKERVAALSYCHNAVREGVTLDANFEGPIIQCMTERHYAFSPEGRHCTHTTEDPDCYAPLSTFGGVTDWIERLWK